MKPAVVATEQRVVLETVSWSTYLALLHDVEQRRGRMTYDRGVLEIMSPSLRHENTKRLLGRLLEAATEELGLDMTSAGSLTMKREDLQRGVEPDECYYIGAGAERVRGKEDLDLMVDPAPDLAIEVDLSHSSLSKLGVYAALGVREFWRYDGDELVVRVLAANGTFVVVSDSSVIAALPLAGVTRFLARRADTGETQILREFRAWLRATIDG